MKRSLANRMQDHAFYKHFLKTDSVDADMNAVEYVMPDPESLKPNAPNLTHAPWDTWGI